MRMRPLKEWVMATGAPLRAQLKDGHMVKFRLICPECWASVVTTHPKELVWELCPQCQHHVWDGYDTLMADICFRDSSYQHIENSHPDN